MGDLHGDHLDAVFARKLEYIRQTGLAMSLERIRAGARLVCPHAGTYLAIFTQCLHHQLDMLQRIHCAQSRENVERILPETYSVVVEMRRAVVILVAPEYAVLF